MDRDERRRVLVHARQTPRLSMPSYLRQDTKHIL
jgi:hypothetical protein